MPIAPRGTQPEGPVELSVGDEGVNRPPDGRRDVVAVDVDDAAPKVVHDKLPRRRSTHQRQPVENLLRDDRGVAHSPPQNRRVRRSDGGSGGQDGPLAGPQVVEDSLEDVLLGAADPVGGGHRGGRRPPAGRCHHGWINVVKARQLKGLGVRQRQVGGADVQDLAGQSRPGEAAHLTAARQHDMHSRRCVRHQPRQQTGTLRGPADVVGVVDKEAHTERPAPSEPPGDPVDVDPAGHAVELGGVGDPTEEVGRRAVGSRARDQHIDTPRGEGVLGHRLGQQHGLAEARSGRHDNSSYVPAGCQQLDQSQAGDQTACHPMRDPLHRPLIRRYAPPGSPAQPPRIWRWRAISLPATFSPAAMEVPAQVRLQCSVWSWGRAGGENLLLSRARRHANP